MMKQYLVVRDSDGLVYGTSMQADPDAGPYVPHDPPMEGVTLLPYDSEFSRTGRRDTEAAYWADGELQWVETAPLDDLVERAISQIDADADAARVSVLVKPTKAEEYMQAETQAREWQASGYLGAAPPDVASWAAAKRRDGMTEQQAAESILAQADQYRNLLSGIRALRLKHMEDARHAADAAGVQACLTAFTVELSTLMKGTT